MALLRIADSHILRLGDLAVVAVSRRLAGWVVSVALGVPFGVSLALVGVVLAMH